MATTDLEPSELTKWDPGLTERVTGLTRPFLKRYFRSEVRGLENIPPGGALLVSNHSGGMFSSPRTSERKYRLRNGLVIDVTRSVRPGSHFVSSDGSVSVEAMRSPPKIRTCSSYGTRGWWLGSPRDR